MVINVIFPCLRAYYFDLAFQLGYKTIIQTWIVGFAAYTNFASNIWLIPLYGSLGAAYGTFTAYAIALILSIALAHKVFTLPLPLLDALKVVLRTILMGIIIWPIFSFRA